ncbi:hypothetical protein Tco_0084481 [Tanacetum coccineum]
MLNELRKMFEKPQAVEIYDLVDLPTAANISPGKVRKSLNKDFGDFVRNFNMHCVGKTGWVISQKPQANKKGKGKGKADKNKQVVVNQPKPKQNPIRKRKIQRRIKLVTTATLVIIGPVKEVTCLFIEEFAPNKNKMAEHGAAASDLPLMARPHAKLLREGLLESINDDSYDKCEFLISVEDDKKPFNNNIEGYALESAVRILIMVLRSLRCEAYVKRDSADKLQQRSIWRFSERDLISQEFSGRDYDLEDDHMDTLPSENTSEIPDLYVRCRCTTRPDVAFAQTGQSLSTESGNLHLFCDEYTGKVIKMTTKSQTGYVFVENLLRSWSDAYNKKAFDMYCDNSAAIIFGHVFWSMKRTLDIFSEYHYGVREQVESGEIKILKVHTDDNLADPFTKALPRGKVTDHANGIGLQLASSFMHTCD